MTMEFVVIHVVIILFVALIKWSSQPDKIDLEIAEEQDIQSGFDEFIKALIKLSLPADEQKEITGSGHVTFEMVDEFETYYNFKQHQYIETGLITEIQKSEIDKLENFLDEQPQDLDDEFWNDNLLDTNKNWETIREMAENVLKLLGKDDLTIAYERRSNGEVVFTKIDLVKKLATEKYSPQTYL